MAGCPGNWNKAQGTFRRCGEAGVWKAVPVTLTVTMTDIGYYSIDRTTTE
ncbi:hypothetical protein HED63_20475 [Ochrobactrum cytisi]|nr:hypothetical protein [Brucella cytisi]